MPEVLRNPITSCLNPKEGPKSRFIRITNQLEKAKGGFSAK